MTGSSFADRLDGGASTGDRILVDGNSNLSLSNTNLIAGNRATEGGGGGIVGSSGADTLDFSGILVSGISSIQGGFVAIVDDLIAILVIAIFYSDSINWAWLAVAVVGLLAVVAMRSFVASPWAYLVPAFVVWLGMLESGIHPTLAGVLLGLLTPARPVGGRHVLQNLEHRLHPISAFVVVPVFALANAGVNLGDGAIQGAVGHRVTWAVAVGLVVGKAFGVAGAALGMLRLGAGALPTGMRAREVIPVAALSGIGFTVALFISDLAFSDPELIRSAKVGIFAGSIIAAILGAALLGITSTAETRRGAT